MAKTHLKDTEEELDKVPSCTGALLEIVEITRGKTSERAKTPGLRKYTPSFRIIEPKKIAGLMIQDHRIVVGTPDDPLAKKGETWDKAGRLKRLLVRSGTPIAEDDEEWMEAAEGNQVVASIREGEDDFPPSLGKYFRPSDEDAPPIGLADGKEAKGSKAKGAAAASKRARGRHVEEAEEEEEDDVDAAEEDEDDEDEPKKGKSPKKAEADDDEEDEEEEEPPAKKARARGGKKKVEEDEEDED